MAFINAFLGSHFLMPISFSYYYDDDGYYRSCRQSVYDLVSVISCFHRSARLLMFKIYG